MSNETTTWLHDNIVVGFTDKRGEAWWSQGRASSEGLPNHYPGAIPLQRVQQLLARPALIEGTVAVTYVNDDGVTTLEAADRKAIIRPTGAFGQDDKGEVLGLFKSSFRLHDYNEWLLDNLGVILDSDLDLSSAGLLKGGAVAFVQVEMPENVDTPEGVTFRPFLSAATSVDGSLASTYQRGAQVIVCDNTLSASLGEKAALRIKVKHSRNSIGRIGEVRDALAIVHQASEDFAAEVAALCQVKVTDRDWDAFLKAHCGDADDMRLSPRSRTMVANHREQLDQLWNHDKRVTDWRGTGWGVVQTVNTHAHHVGTVKRTSRVERNALRAVTGAYDKLDTHTVETLMAVVS